MEGVRVQRPMTDMIFSNVDTGIRDDVYYGLFVPIDIDIKDEVLDQIENEIKV